MAMRCYGCGEALLRRNVEYCLKTQRGMVRVVGVPARVCPHCGYREFDGAVLELLDRMRERINAEPIGASGRLPARVEYAPI